MLIELAEPQSLEFPRPVVFDLTDFQMQGDFIHMRAVDDLAGCAAILAAIASLAESPPPGDVFAVFTRAEEVGLVGARLMAEAGSLPPETLVLSAESSRTLPGAEMGSGPVIRVGDAGYTFTAEAEAASDSRSGNTGIQARGVQSPAPTDERRSLRGQRLCDVWVSDHRHCFSPW